MFKRTVFITAMVLIVALSFAIEVVQAGSLDPTAAPAPTMKTLDEIPPTWSQTLTASQRFVVVLGGTGVLDKETGLVWTKNANSWGAETMASATLDCYSMSLGSRMGWRLPTMEELASLIDPTQSNPALPSGHPFTSPQSNFYWSATTSATGSTHALGVNLSANGSMVIAPKTSAVGYVWCVRGGKGYDVY